MRGIEQNFSAGTQIYITAGQQVARDLADIAVGLEVDPVAGLQQAAVDRIEGVFIGEGFGLKSGKGVDAVTVGLDLDADALDALFLLVEVIVPRRIDTDVVGRQLQVAAGAEFGADDLNHIFRLQADVTLSLKQRADIVFIHLPALVVLLFGKA